MEPKHLYTIRWTQPYHQENEYLSHLQALYYELVEAAIDDGDLLEAQAEIARIMAL